MLLPLYHRKLRIYQIKSTPISSNGIFGSKRFDLNQELYHLIFIFKKYMLLEYASPIVMQVVQVENVGISIPSGSGSCHNEKPKRLYECIRAYFLSLIIYNGSDGSRNQIRVRAYTRTGYESDQINLIRIWKSAWYASLSSFLPGPDPDLCNTVISILVWIRIKGALKHT